MTTTIDVIRCFTDGRPVNNRGGHKRHRNRRDTVCGPCATANREQDRQYRSANREKLREKNRQYRSANREKLREKKRRHRAANRDQAREYYRQYRAANLDKMREQSREQQRRRWAANREQARERQRRRYAENRGKIREQNRIWRAANNDKIREQDRLRRAANNDKMREQDRRRYRQRGGKKPRRYADQIAARDGWLCSYCGKLLMGCAYHVDHRWPVSRANTYPGNDINELDNLCLACPDCNLSKGAHTAEEFAEYLRTSDDPVRSVL